MLLRKNETHEYNGWFDTPRRCRVRLGLPAEGSGHDAFIVISTDGNQTEGANITKAVESLAVPLCRKFDISPERTIFSEHHGRRRGDGGHDDLGRMEDFTRVVFEAPQEAKAHFDPIRGTILGKPGWEYTDKKSVEELIDCPPLS